jgi:restriction system protein
MPRQRESNLELLLKAPWWISAALGVISFAAIRWGLPAWAGDVNARQMIAKGVSLLAPLPLLFFALIAIGSFLFAKKRSRLVDEQSSLEKLRETGWKDFEYLVAEAFRRQGYQVEFSLGRGADGGVDLTLRRDGRASLVQCKQWKVFSVGAPVIREMFGLLTAKKADEAIIVTSGKFTRDAQEFAAGKPIQLIDGPQLLTLVRSVQTQINTAEKSDSKSPVSSFDSDGVIPQAAACCPSCGQPMVLRTSKRGVNAGNQFWGCSTYPACKGTRNVAKTGIPA